MAVLLELVRTLSALEFSDASSLLVLAVLGAALTGLAGVTIATLVRALRACGAPAPRPAAVPPVPRRGMRSVQWRPDAPGRRLPRAPGALPVT